MNGQELATAVQYGLAVIFVVVDNGMYGTIRMHQERNYPARVSGTALDEPGLCRAGPRVRRARRDRAADRRSSRPPSSARSPRGKPALLHLKLDPQALTPERLARRAARAGSRREAALARRADEVIQ